MPMLFDLAWEFHAGSVLCITGTMVQVPGKVEGEKTSLVKMGTANLIQTVS